MSSPVTALGPDTRELLELLAFTYLENGRPDKAAALLAALETLQLADSRTRTALALAYLRAGKPDTALAVLERTALAGRIDATFHLVHAQTLSALQRRDEAAVAMRAYTSLRPASPQSAPTGPSATS